MNLKISSFWKTTPEPNNILDAAEWTANTAGAGLGLAVALGIANPALGIAAASLAFASPFKKVIEVASKREDNKLTLEEVVIIAAPLAYVKSFNYWIERNSILGAKIKQKPNYTNKVSPNITNFTLEHDLATNALRSFHKSELGNTFNQVLSSQLHEYKLNDTEVKITVAWVAWKAGCYFKEVIEEIKVCQELQIDDAHRIDIYVRSGENDENNSYSSIEKYLNEQIANAPKELVFKEQFSFEQIYVPLKIKSVDLHGQIVESSKTEEIEDWAKSLLSNYDKANQVMFIQAAPGRGKSVFCRIFADWIRQHFHPFWIPILIRLRDVESFDNLFENTLQAAIKTRFAKDDDWLVNSESRFLFILDGFDEIRLEGRARGSLEKFIKQVASFQESCSRSSEMGHRFILTGRQLALQGISYLPDNLERVELLPMDDWLQQQWLDKWKKVVAQDPKSATTKTSAFKLFLRSSNLSNEVKEELAREPLLLYLLAAMHRDGKINVEKLTGKDRIENEISIYEQAIDWVLIEQRKLVQKELVKLEISELKQVLIEAGLAVTQSGGESAKIIAIENWLSKSRPPIANKIKKIRETQGDEVLKNALAAFYIKPKEENYEESTVEFFHSSFGEFLCAKRIHQSMTNWVKWNDEINYYQTTDRQFAEEIYDVFGYGNLTPDITKYLFGLLEKKDDFIIINLFKRLEYFYSKWCKDEFINTSETTFSQKKMRQLNKELPDKKLSLGQNSVEVFTVLNVLIILFKLHFLSQSSETLKSKIDFHPCVDDSNRLLKIVGLSFCLGIDGFPKTIGSFLAGANLSGVNFSGVNFSGVNFSGANLSGAILRQANLTDANLSKANLSDCDMCRCDLTDANLQNAILENAYLRGADCRNAMFNQAILSGADLCRAYLHNTDLSNVTFFNTSVRKANLDAANFQGANFENLQWDVHTNWLNAKGLHQIKNPPKDLSNNLDYQNGVELSKAYEMLEQGQISDAISKCTNVTNRIEDSKFQAHIYNRFAWLCSLLNENNQCREEIANLADRAVKLNPQSGNYKDTLAIATILNPNIFDMPPIIGRADDDDEPVEQKNPYEYAIRLLKEALESEDFKKLALPNVKKIRQRRQDWIKSLEVRINPLTSETIFLLLKEEY
jgi:hypothetical protein